METWIFLSNHQLHFINTNNISGEGEGNLGKSISWNWFPIADQRAHKAAAEKHMFEPKPKKLASLRSVGWQASRSSNSRLKSGGGKIPSLHAEGKFCNIYLAALNLEQLSFGESLQNDPLKTVKSFTLYALVLQSLHSPLLYEIFGDMVNNTLASKPQSTWQSRHPYLTRELIKARAFAILH